MPRRGWTGRCRARRYNRRARIRAKRRPVPRHLLAHITREVLQVMMEEQNRVFLELTKSWRWSFMEEVRRAQAGIEFDARGCTAAEIRVSTIEESARSLLPRS